MERTVMIGESPLVFEVRRSRRRRTVALRVDATGAVIVHTPSFVWGPFIDRFVRQQESWILKKLDAVKRWRAQRLLPDDVTPEDQARYKAQTQERLPAAIARYSERLGVLPRSVRVAHQTRRWGSCSSRGDLRFSWKLALLPDDVFDYVVVHELAHLAVMNHSPAFWAKVASVCPDFKIHRRWLRQQA